MSKTTKFILIFALIEILVIHAGFVYKANLPTSQQTAKIDTLNFYHPAIHHTNVCPTCQCEYKEPIYFLNCNTGELYTLNLLPYADKGVFTLTVIYDKLSHTKIDMHQDTYSGTFASISQMWNIISKPRMKNTFCDDCRQKLLVTINGQYITSFVIFLPQEQAFYPIADGLEIQIAGQILSVNYDSEYETMRVAYYL